jgi:hypothetical protein
MMGLYDFQDYIEFGCDFYIEFGVAFAGLYTPCKTKGENVCDGCHKKGKCAPEKMMQNRKLNQSYKPKSFYEKTNKQIADEL